MARKNANGLELSFKPYGKSGKSGGRWTKVVEGSTRYFGDGGSVDDRNSYLTAMRKYLDFVDQHKKANEPLVPVAPGAPDMKPSELTEKYQIGWQASIAEAKVTAAKGKGWRFCELVDLFLAQQSRRCSKRRFILEQQAKGIAIAEKKKENISEARFSTISDTCKVMKKLLGEEVVEDSKEAVQALMKKWQNLSDDLLVSSKISASTYSERMKEMKMLVRWAWKENHFRDLPRNIDELCNQYKIESSAIAIDAKILRKIFDAACDEMKLWICLGLNCGAYAIDISTLTGAMVRGDYIERPRHKTGVPTKFKLWGITKRLLQPYLATDGLLFATRGGKPLVRYHANGKGRNDQVQYRFAYLLKKLEVEGCSFSNLRDTASTAIKNIDASMQELFLGHADNGLAKIYTDASKVTSIQPRLDSVVMKLDRLFQLGQKQSMELVKAA